MIRVLVNQKLGKKFYSSKIFSIFCTMRIDTVQRIEEQDFFDTVYSTLIMSNKTSKQTTVNRFFDLEAKTIQHLKSFDRLSIHDIAVSSGVTSYKLYHLLLDNKIEFHLNISDKFSTVYLARDRLLDVLYDENNEIIGLYFGFLYLSDNLSWKFCISRFLFHLFKNFIKKNIKKESYRLFDYKILKLIKTSEISAINFDIFETQIENKFNFVRVMNILNRSYFSEEKIKCAILNIFISLNEGGILLLGRTVGNINNATFFKKHSDRLVKIDSINNGSEIEDLIINLFIEHEK